MVIHMAVKTANFNMRMSEQTKLDAEKIHDYPDMILEVIEEERFELRDIARYIVLKIDGKVAAFLAGYVDEKNSSLLIPRLAISGDYNRYSPGVVCSSMKA